MNSLPPINNHIVPFSLYPLLRILVNPPTYNEALRMHSTGAINQQQFKWFRLHWTWSCHRFSDVEGAATKQDRFYTRAGLQALERRFLRAEQLRQKLYLKHFAPYLRSNSHTGFTPV